MQTPSETCVEVEKSAFFSAKHIFYFLDTHLLKNDSTVQNCSEYLAV